MFEFGNHVIVDKKVNYERNQKYNCNNDLIITRPITYHLVICISSIQIFAWLDAFYTKLSINERSNEIINIVSLVFNNEAVIDW